MCLYTALVGRVAIPVVLVLAAVAASAGLRGHAAQGPVSPTPPDETVTRVTAIVTDHRGQLVSGLKPADFQITVDGKPQTLESAELTRSDTAAPRTFAFLLDEFHTAAGDSAAIRDALLRFIERSMRRSDRALVVKPLDTLTEITTTSDFDAVKKAVASFEGRKGDFTPKTAFERDYMAQAPEAVAQARAQVVTSALRAIGTTLSDTAAPRPVIVLVTDGFARMRSRRDLPANLQTAIRVANRADAPVYAFAPALTAPVDPAQPDPAYTALSTLTAQTGGQLVTGIGTFESGLARMAADLDTHYTLTYRPAHGSDGRFHAIEVSVKRPGAQLRARTGYVAPVSAQVRAAAAAPPAPLRALRRSALIQMWSGVISTAPGRVTIMLTWEPSDTRAATTPRPRAASIVVTAATTAGELLFDGQIAPIGGLPASSAFATFEATSATVRLDTKVLDSKGIVIDTDSRDVTVPPARPGLPTIYPPAIVRTQSAREFRDFSTDPHAAPVPRREFRRTERLLVRVPATDASGALTAVTATLLNRLRQPMRDVPAMEQEAIRGVTQFDLPLSSLAPGDYSIRLTATGSGGSVSEYVSFRIIG